MAVDAPVPPLATGKLPVKPPFPKGKLESTGLVNVLLVKFSEPANVANVPVKGKVTFVVPVVVNVVAKAPEVVRLPPKVIVLPELLTPVPPYCPAIKLPFQVPVVIVPTVNIELEPAAGEAPTVL